jgi:hypothetical protein
MSQGMPIAEPHQFERVGGFAGTLSADRVSSKRNTLAVTNQLLSVSYTGHGMAMEVLL